MDVTIPWCGKETVNTSGEEDSSLVVITLDERNWKVLFILNPKFFLHVHRMNNSKVSKSVIFTVVHSSSFDRIPVPPSKHKTKKKRPIVETWISGLIKNLLNFLHRNPVYTFSVYSQITFHVENRSYHPVIIFPYWSSDV